MGFFERFKKQSKAEPQAPKHGVASAVKPKVVSKPVETKSTTEKSPAKKADQAASPIVRGPSDLAYRSLLRPLITEKATMLQSMNKYVFEVESSASADRIARAVETVYGVRPINVNVSNNKGKFVRYGRSFGRRANWRKAVVTLKAGETIDVYKGIA